MRFLRLGDLVIAERPKTGQKFSLKLWQYEFLLGLDGKKNFEEVAKGVYQKYQNGFTPSGLFGFFQWLYSENLVECECNSIFELVLDDSEDFNVEEQVNFGTPSTVAPLVEENIHPQKGKIIQFSHYGLSHLKHPLALKSMAVATGVAFLLSGIRIMQVASPLLEPAAAHLAIMIAPNQNQLRRTASERIAAKPGIEKVAPAAQVTTTSDEVESAGELVSPKSLVSHPERSVAADTVKELETEIEQEQPAQAEKAPLITEIERLRAELEECRIRRDEYYLQNDEAGYRREVHRMTSLANEIGTMENE